LKKVWTLFLTFFFGSFLCAYAAEVANFVDFGFSPDGTIYMFGEYGVKEGTLTPWARMYIVDVAKNDFVQGGILTYRHDAKVVAGHDGEGALYAIVGQNPDITRRYGMNYLKQGTPLYISLLNGHDTATQLVEFRDFENGSAYKAVLDMQYSGLRGAAKSSFDIRVERRLKNGTTNTYRVGDRSIQRANVNSYSVKKVFINRASNSIVFIIEMKLAAADGQDVRYMVETLAM
jgi:predicted secreted protein